MADIMSAVSAAVLAAALMFTVTGQIHMLQQNSYFISRYTLYLKGDFSYQTVFSFIASAATAALAAAMPWKGIPLLAFALVSSFFRCASAVSGQKKAKKPLVFTARVRRLYAASGVLLAIAYLLFMIFSVSMTLYVYIMSALLFLSPFYVILLNIIMMPAEKAVNAYYINDARKILASRPELKVIGVTGSFGKTSTKYALGRLLGEKYNVLITPGSFNTLLGVVRTVRERLTPATQVFVVEMGAKRPGDIKEICDLVKPQLGVITSIGGQHLSTFGSIENITKTKFELYDAVEKNGGTVFLNFDNEYIRAEAARRSGKTVSYGTSDAAQVFASDISASSAGSAFALNASGERFDIKTRLLGTHNVCNIAGAAAVCLHLGMGQRDIKYAAQLLESVEHRLELHPFIGGSVLIDDSYNSNPVGCIEAVNVLASFEGRKKIAVTPGVIELGEEEYSVNYRLGEAMCQKADEIILVGEKRAVPMLDAAKAAHFDSERLHVVPTFAAAMELLRGMCGKDTAVLFENDLPDNYEKQ